MRDIEKLASHFPDVNKQAVIQAFWNGIHQSTRLRLIEWGISPEHTSLERIVCKAISIEASEDAYSGEVRACQEIGLVAFMFFFELLFSYVSLQFPPMFSLTNLFSIIPFLIC